MNQQLASYVSSIAISFHPGYSVGMVTVTNKPGCPVVHQYERSRVPESDSAKERHEHFGRTDGE